MEAISSASSVASSNQPAPVGRMYKLRCCSTVLSRRGRRDQNQRCSRVRQAEGRLGAGADGIPAGAGMCRN